MKGNSVMSNLKYTSDMVGAVSRKGYEAMSNAHVTSDMTGARRVIRVPAYYRLAPKPRPKTPVTGAYDIVGGLGGYGWQGFDGGDSMLGQTDRKGGDVMTNARRTSAMTGAYDIVGAAVRQDIVGGCHGPITGAQEKEVRVAAAKVNIDNRILSVLKPAYAVAYKTAIESTSVGVFDTAAVVLLLAVCGDTGITGMVQSHVKTIGQFGGAWVLKRAMVRRLNEKRASLG